MVGVRWPVDGVSVDPGQAYRPIRIGNFEILPDARSIIVNGVPVALGSRAFDLLMALVRADGAVLSPQELLGAVWPNLTVVDTNLKVQLFYLRRALGSERWRVQNVSGRGYLLVTDKGFGAAAAAGAGSAKAAEKPLIVVIDADKDTRGLLKRALAETVRSLDADARLSFICGEPDLHPR